MKQMRVRWNKLLVNVAFWLTAEIVLTVLGLDTVADFGEFVVLAETLANPPIVWQSDPTVI